MCTDLLHTHRVEPAVYCERPAESNTHAYTTTRSERRTMNSSPSNRLTCSQNR
ncbi:hypothetical protein QTP88_006950 [Uroleucon formosanum]